MNLRLSPFDIPSPIVRGDEFRYGYILGTLIVIVDMCMCGKVIYHVDMFDRGDGRPRDERCNISAGNLSAW